MDWNIRLPENEIPEGLVKCNFCNNTQVPKDQVFEGEEVAICHDCVRLTAAQVEGPSETPGTEPENPRTCNFCQQQQEFAGAIFAANERNIYICTDCVTRFAESLGQSVG